MPGDLRGRRRLRRDPLLRRRVVRPRKANGQSCGGGGECVSGKCVDGVLLRPRLRRRVRPLRPRRSTWAAARCVAAGSSGAEPLVRALSLLGLERELSRRLCASDLGLRRELLLQRRLVHAPRRATARPCGGAPRVPVELLRRRVLLQRGVHRAVQRRAAPTPGTVHAGRRGPAGHPVLRTVPVLRRRARSARRSCAERRGLRCPGTSAAARAAWRRSTNGQLVQPGRPVRLGPLRGRVLLQHRLRRAVRRVQRHCRGCAPRRAPGYAGSPSCAPYVCSGASASVPGRLHRRRQLRREPLLRRRARAFREGHRPELQRAAGQCQSGNCVDGYCCNAPVRGAVRRLPRAAGRVLDARAGMRGQPLVRALPVRWPERATCPTSCSADAHCAPGNYCNGSACVGGAGRGRSVHAGRAVRLAPLRRRASAARAPATARATCATPPPGRCTAGDRRARPAPRPALPTCATGASAACPASCALDTDCAPGFFCNAGTCVESLADGAVCTRPRQCQSGYCVDGDVLQHRLRARPATRATCSGSEGACTVVAAGAGRMRRPARPTCCDGAAAALPRRRAPSDTQCVASSYCAGGTCFGKKPVGAACALGAECTSTFCVDGYCCESACGGQLRHLRGDAGHLHGRGRGLAGDAELYALRVQRRAADLPDELRRWTSTARPGTTATARRAGRARASGAACGTGHECQSGHCADGVCCSTPLQRPLRRVRRAAGHLHPCAGGRSRRAELRALRRAAAPRPPAPRRAPATTGCAAGVLLPGGELRRQAGRRQRCAAAATSAARATASTARAATRACAGACDRCDLDPARARSVGRRRGRERPSCSPFVCDGASPSCPTSCAADAGCAIGTFCERRQLRRAPRRPGARARATPCAPRATASTGSAARPRAPAPATSAPRRRAPAATLPAGEARTPSCDALPVQRRERGLPGGLHDGRGCVPGTSATPACACPRWSRAPCARAPRQCASGYCVDGYCCDTRVRASVRGLRRPGRRVQRRPPAPGSRPARPTCATGSSARAPRPALTSLDCSLDSFCDEGECVGAPGERGAVHRRQAVRLRDVRRRRVLRVGVQLAVRRVPRQPLAGGVRRGAARATPARRAARPTCATASPSSCPTKCTSDERLCARAALHPRRLLARCCRTARRARRPRAAPRATASTASAATPRCTGACSTCAAAGSVGTCSRAAAGTDPRNQCPGRGPLQGGLRRRRAVRLSRATTSRAGCRSAPT